MSTPDPRAPRPPSRPPLLVLATLDTRSFSFVALAETREAAAKALLEGWDKHADATGAFPGLMREALADGDVNFTPISTGDVLRDGALIHYTN